MTTTDNFFGDEDYESVEVRDFDPNAFRLEAGRHRVQISKAEAIDKKDGSVAFIIEYSDKDGKTYTHWLNAIEPGDEVNFPGKGDTSLKDIKRAERVRVLEQAGVSRSNIPRFKGDDILGTEGYLTVYKKGQYMRYGKFELLSKSGLTHSSASNGMTEFKAAETAISDEDKKAFGF